MMVFEDLEILRSASSLNLQNTTAQKIIHGFCIVLFMKINANFCTLQTIQLSEGIYCPPSLWITELHTPSVEKKIYKRRKNKYCSINL